MACLVSDVQMSEEEKACCREMSGQCSEMHGSSGHSCCKAQMQPQQAALQKHPAPDQIHIMAAALPAVGGLSASHFAIHRPLSWHHPPPLPEVSSPILRI